MSSEHSRGPSPEKLPAAASGAEPDGPVRRLPPPAVWEGIAAATGVRAAPDPEALRRSLIDDDNAATTVFPAPAPTVSPRPQSIRRWSTPVLLGSAGLALAVGVGVGALMGWRAGAAPAVALISGAQLSPLEGGDATWTGTAEVVEDADDSRGGRRVVVTTSGLPAVEGGAHEVWLLDPATGGLVSLGALAHGDSPQGGYVLPEGVDLSRFSQVDISVEPLDGDPTHSGATELRGPLVATSA